MQSKRLRIIQRALTLLYLAAVCFLFTSVALGGVTPSGAPGTYCL